MSEKILEKLRKSGLTGNESKVYYELLRRGELSANTIAKSVSMDRTLTYTVLNHLIEKGMVSYVIKDHKKMFLSASPDNLLNPIKEKKAYIEDLIPELKQIEQIVVAEQEIRIFEGKEGIRNLVNLALKYKEFCSFGATGWAYSKLYEMPRVVKEISKKKIRVRVIGDESFRGKNEFSLANFKYRFLKVKSKSPTSIFGDHVSIHLTTREKPFVILIKNKDIAETYQNYFEVMWKIAKK